MSTQHWTLNLMERDERPSSCHDFTRPGENQPETPFLEPSSWSRSTVKRIFDCMCVLLALPSLIPVFAVIAVAVRLTSRGPVLFRQQRMGKMGQSFTILKFRTMLHVKERATGFVATVGNGDFTPVGRFLRCWKLDELPQLFNILVGHMSLVGPRPKMIEHSTSVLRCRPGITGVATVAFAREEVLLNGVPKGRLDEFYHAVVLPAKLRLDDEYMSCATFASDMKLLIDTVFRRWDSSYLEILIAEAVLRSEGQIPQLSAPAARREQLELALH